MAQVPTREQLQPKPATIQPPRSVQVDTSGAFERGPCPLPEDLRVRIRSITFAAPSGAALPETIASLLGEITPSGDDQPIAAVCDLRDRANAILRHAHYVASVQIPPQTIDDGVLRLEVVTARIVEMRVRGDPGPYEALLSRRIAALKALDPLNERDAERILLIAGDIPGLDVALALRPAGGAPGDVIGDLTVTYNPISVIANVQNYNSRQLGRETGYVRAEINGITGLSDSAYLGLSSTADFQEQQIIQGGYASGIGDSGTTLGLRGTYALSKPDLDTLKLTTRSIIVGIDAARPLLRTVAANVNVSGGFEFVQQKTKVATGNGGAPLNLDRIAALSMRISGDYRVLRADGSEQSAVSTFAEVRKGLDIFDASKIGIISPSGYAPSRFEGDARAFIARGQVNTRIGLGPIFDLATEIRGQYANHPLLNYDEFSLGNLTIGRGYDPGSNGGDRAIAVSLEARANVIRTPKIGVQVFAFHDAVHLWNLDKNSTESNRVLRSYGGGFRVILPRALILDATYAHPRDPVLLTGSSNRPPPDRVLISLTAQLLPFRSGR